MPRHSLRRNSRRFALALSLMLVAGAVALPAFAQGPPKYFSVDVGEVDGTFTVTFHNESRNTDLGAARITVPTDPFVEPQDLVGPVGSSVSFADGVIEVTDLGIAPRDSAAITFGVADCGQTYTFTDPEAKQANDFSGEPGNDLEYRSADGHSLTVVTPDCPGDDPFADFDNVVDCDDPQFEHDDCLIQEGSFQARTGSTEGRMGLRIVSAEASVDEDDIAALLRDACDDLLVGVQRLGGVVAHLLPLGLDGDHITVTSTIPRSHVNTDENRSAHIFQVCFAPEKDTVGVHKDLAEIIVDEEATGLYGPVILRDCGDDVPAPCVEDRSKVRADVVLTYRIPAEDPWLM